MVTSEIIIQEKTICQKIQLCHQIKSLINSSGLRIRYKSVNIIIRLVLDVSSSSWGEGGFYTSDVVLYTVVAACMYYITYSSYLIY